jgi:hypothetical protein
MKLTLTETDVNRVADCLEECLKITDEYRHVLGDEDSIVLRRNLLEIGETLEIADASGQHGEAGAGHTGQPQ